MLDENQHKQQTSCQHYTTLKNNPNPWTLFIQKTASNWTHLVNDKLHPPAIICPLYFWGMASSCISFLWYQILTIFTVHSSHMDNIHTSLVSVHLWLLLNFLCWVFPAMQKTYIIHYKSTMNEVRKWTVMSLYVCLRLLQSGYKIVDLTLVSRYPRLTLAVGYLTSPAAVKSVNRSQPPPRSKWCEAGAATHPPATWPGVTWTHPPKPQKSCTLNHFACQNNQANL